MRTPVTHNASTRPSTQPQDDTSANVAHDTSSPIDSINDTKTTANMEKFTSKADTKILNVDEEHGEEVSNMMALKERTIELDEGQAGSDLGMTPKSQPSPERELMEENQARSDRGQSHVAHAEPNPEPMHKDFIAIVYPKVHEILKLTTKEQVYIENPPSSSETFLSMKNLEDTFTFDQFEMINPKGNRVVHDINKPLPLGGPPGQVTIQAQYFFNKDLEYLVSESVIVTIKPVPVFQAENPPILFEN
nr:hypothetical protein [Tanacetum cinerariifolium]